LLYGSGRVGEALLWVEAALVDFRAVGPGAANEIVKAERLLAATEQDQPFSDA